MRIADMCMALLLLMGAVDLIGDYPEESLRLMVGILELVAGIWFFLVWVPKFIDKFKADGKFRDFVVSLSITFGLMLCIGYTHEELFENEWIATALMLVVFSAILLAKRLTIIMRRKYGKEIS